MDQRYKYHVMDIVTNAAVTNLPVQINGERLLYKTGTGDIRIRLNSTSNDEIVLSPKEEIIAPFDTFFVSSDGALDISMFVSTPVDLRLDSKQVDVEQISSVEKTADASHGNISVTAAAAPADLIVDSDSERKCVIIQNLGAATVYIGTSNAVTVSNGIRLQTGESLTLDRYTGSIYGIVAAGNADIRYLTEGV